MESSSEKKRFCMSTSGSLSIDDILSVLRKAGYACESQPHAEGFFIKCMTEGFLGLGKISLELSIFRRQDNEITSITANSSAQYRFFGLVSLMILFAVDLIFRSSVRLRTVIKVFVLAIYVIVLLSEEIMVHITTRRCLRILKSIDGHVKEIKRQNFLELLDGGKTLAGKG